MRKKVLIGFLILILFFFPLSNSFAFADDLVIENDGGIFLILTDNSVLAESTNKANEGKKASPPPARTVPLVPAKSESKVEIKAPINNDKKVQVTITPAPKTQAQAQTQTKTQTPTQTPTPITKTVDQVVAQGANGQTVFSIKSEKANQLTISQEETQVKTALPLQINTASHALSVPSSSGGTGSDRISVLPKEAVQGIINKGILENKNISDAKISLTKDASGVNYTVQTEKSGKLFGLVPVKAPKEVSLSAQTGKVITTPRSVIFDFVGNFIK